MDITIDYIKHHIRDYNLVDESIEVYLRDDTTILIDSLDIDKNIILIDNKIIAAIIYDNDKYRSQVK